MLAGLTMLLSALCVPLASAHVTGNYLERTVGEYLVDIGYDTFTILEKQTIVFNAALIKDAGSLEWDYAPADALWIQITPPHADVFRTFIPIKQPGPVNASYTFDEPGTYRLAVRFLEGETVLAETSFPLTVHSIASQTSQTKTIALTLFAAFLAFVIYTKWARRTQERKTVSHRRTR